MSTTWGLLRFSHLNLVGKIPASDREGRKRSKQVREKIILFINAFIRVLTPKPGMSIKSNTIKELAIFLMLLKIQNISDSQP